MAISDLLEPIADGTKDQVFITKSLDATSHFESVAKDVEDCYFRIMGKKMVLQKREEGVQEAQ